MKKILLVFLTLAGSAFAELPPSAYSSMQAKAADVVTVDVLRVENTPGTGPGEHQIAVLAQVNTVKRSTDGVQPGDFITIIYTVTQRQAGWAGPGQIPILNEKDETVAFLNKDSSTGNFSPAAGRMSFSEF